MMRSMCTNYQDTVLAAVYCDNAAIYDRVAESLT